MSLIRDNFIQSYEVNLNAAEIIIHTILKKNLYVISDPII